MDRTVSSDWNRKIALSVLCGLKHCFDNGTFTDTDIKVEHKIFRCHKVVLCSISDYFQAMFTSGMKESIEGKVSLAGVTCEVFQDILSFYYQGRSSVVHVDNVEDLMRASTLLQMKCLQRFCEQFYINQLSFHNAIGIWQLAKNLHCEFLCKKAVRYILRHFQDISNESEITLLEVDELVILLSDNDIRLPDEDAVANVALQWICHDFKRRIHMQTICKCLRLPLLSNEALQQILLYANKDKGSPLELIEQVLCQRSQQSEQVVATSEEVRLRNFEEVLVVLGMRTSAGLKPSTNAYSFLQKQWFTLEAVPLDPGVGYAVCTCDNDIYMSGRSGKLTYLIRYNSEIDQWLDCPEMLVKRAYHEMIAHNDSLFIVGGSNKHDGAMCSVDVYDVSRCSWNHFSDLIFGVYSTSAAIINNSLIVFGGRGALSRQTQEVQLMNLDTGTASIASFFPSPISESRALVIKDEVFITSTNGVIMKAFDDGALFPYTRIPSFDRYNFGVFKHQGHLIVAGGETRYPSGNESFDDMIKVDIIDDDNAPKKTSILFDSLYRNASSFGCQKILLHRAYLNLPITCERL